MSSKVRRKYSPVLAGLLLLQLPGFLLAQNGGNQHRELVNQFNIPPEAEPRMSHGDMIEQLRKKVKYVFVIYQENRSFDSYFGTFPGAEGLYSHPAADTPGFTQYLLDTTGASVPISPFRIGPYDTCPNSTVNGTVSPATCYAADTDDIDHSHPRTVAKMDIVSGVPLMDQFARVEELKYSSSPTPTLQAKQMGELAMAHEDCDTVPLLWGYAG